MSILSAAETLAAGVVEVRALADGVTHSGYFDDYGKLACAVEALDADPSITGIYVTLNAVNPALLARRVNRIKMRLSRKDATTADTDIIRRRWLPIDIDPVRPSGVSSTDAEHAAAIDAAGRIAGYLAEQGFPEPLIADSGNGAHLLYRIDLPNDEAATELVKGVLVTLDALFSSDRVTVDTANHNAGRIWKLYGTVSRKGDSTPERPHRRAKILNTPGEMAVVPVEKLQAIAGLLPREEPPRQKKGGRKIDLASWLLDHGVAVRSAKPWSGGTLYALAECPFSGAHKDGAFAIQFANGAIHAGCHHASCGGGAQRWPELRAMHEPRGKKEAVNGASESVRTGALATKKETPRAKTGAVEAGVEDPTPPPDEYHECALEILRTGDPLGFMLDTFNKTHVGDRTVAECLALSIASQSIENTNGLHVAISGNSGKGKSHACTTMLQQVPEDYRLTGTVSDKALYYADDLRAGTVFLFDDVSLSDDLQEVLKAATANFRVNIQHQTVTTDRKLQVCSIPERCVWWLAKVEDSGDDQVANRMLSVWIDDSTEQDRAVLEHMKQVEAREDADDSEDADLPVCQAIWRILKEERIHISIPYAERVHFATTANRRNPGILFDLIKGSALLHRFQREEYDGGIRANLDDFATAVRIYDAINGKVGGQETKTTKNEAAALETVATMGWEQFTIKMLQEALGLSYHQTYRILHGYTKRGTTYSGLLEKCPAISFFDTTITGDVDGYAVRRREHLFSFDAAVYRRWAHSGGVWLDEDGGGGEGGDQDPDGGSDTCTFATGFGQVCTTCRKDETAQSSVGSTNNCTDREKRLSLSTNLHQNTHTVTGTGSGVSESLCLCENRNGANNFSMQPVRAASTDRSQLNRSFICTTWCKAVQSGAKQGSVVQESLPGVLDHRTFERVRVDLGRCEICGKGKAVYRSKEVQAGICEGCYVRLVREWNAKAGVR